eukprot:814321_1
MIVFTLLGTIVEKMSKSCDDSDEYVEKELTDRKAMLHATDDDFIKIQEIHNKIFGPQQNAFTARLCGLFVKYICQKPALTCDDLISKGIWYHFGIATHYIEDCKNCGKAVSPLVLAN